MGDLGLVTLSRLAFVGNYVADLAVQLLSAPPRISEAEGEFERQAAQLFDFELGPGGWLRSLAEEGIEPNPGPSQTRDERQRGQAAARKGGRTARRQEAACASCPASIGLAYQDSLSPDEMSQLAASLGDQLLADTVKPQTGRHYIRALQGLHGFLVQGACLFTTGAEKDRSVAAYLGWLWGRAGIKQAGARAWRSGST